MTWHPIGLRRTPHVLLSCSVVAALGSLVVAVGSQDHPHGSGSFTGHLDQQAGSSFPLIAPGQDGSITVAAVGDIMMGSTFPDYSRLPPDAGRHLLDEMAPNLQDSDIVFGNLEGPLLEGGTSTKCPPLRTLDNASPMPRAQLLRIPSTARIRSQS